MTALITLTIAGSDTGPFDLYSNINGYTVPFETNVSKTSLLAGYISALVPNDTGIIRVDSTGACNNFVDLQVLTTSPPTSSTTTTALPTTSTTTTILSSSTTTTQYTTVVPPTGCVGYNLSCQAGGCSVDYFDCNNTPQTAFFDNNTFICTDGGYSSVSGVVTDSGPLDCSN